MFQNQHKAQFFSVFFNKMTTFHLYSRIFPLNSRIFSLNSRIFTLNSKFQKIYLPALPQSGWKNKPAVLSDSDKCYVSEYFPLNGLSEGVLAWHWCCNAISSVFISIPSTCVLSRWKFLKGSPSFVKHIIFGTLCSEVSFVQGSGGHL